MGTKKLRVVLYFTMTEVDSIDRKREIEGYTTRADYLRMIVMERVRERMVGVEEVPFLSIPFPPTLSAKEEPLAQPLDLSTIIPRSVREGSDDGVDETLELLKKARRTGEGETTSLPGKQVDGVGKEDTDDNIG